MLVRLNNIVDDFNKFGVTIVEFCDTNVLYQDEDVAQVIL